MKFEEWLAQQDWVIDVDCGCVTTEAFYHWLRVAYEAGNSPVTTDGYVMVPKEMTDEIGEAIAMQANCCGGIALDIYDAMLAAAPHDTPALNSVQSVVTVPGKWIPVSDRLPFDEIVTLPKPMGGPFLVAYSSGRVDITWFSCWQDAGGRCGKWDTENTTLSIAMKLGKVTHWMPLPAAPQEVKGE